MRRSSDGGKPANAVHPTFDISPEAASPRPPNAGRRERAYGRRRRRAAVPVNAAATFADLVPASVRFLFHPDFLQSVAEEAHRELLDALGITRVLGPATTVGEMYERLYAEMRRSYRTEYLYKNEVIRRVFEARHDPDDATVLLERPIAGWKTRVDMVVVNDTTSAYEIKTDRDDLSRLRRQTDLSLAAFDRVFVVCSDAWADDVLAGTDHRVGVYAMRRSGALSRRRPFTANAANVDQGAVFSILRRAEYLAAIAEHFSCAPPADPSTQYDESLALFKKIPPRVAHRYLLRALRARFVRGGDANRLRGLPYALAHLYYKASAGERLTLFSSAVLGRPLG
jgi:hypothetical protein